MAIRSARKVTPARRPELLTEATINIPDGMSITDWLHELEEEAIKATAAVLPPAAVDERGRYPDQWLRMVDATPTEVLVCVSRWGCGADSFQTHFRVPYTSDDAGKFTTAAPVEVEVEYRAVYTDVPSTESEVTPPAPEASMAEQISEAVAGLHKKKDGAVALAETLLTKASGKHPLAASLAVELSRARAA